MQVVRHFWERNDIKGAIDAAKKLPDHSVSIYWRISNDVVCFFSEFLLVINFWFVKFLKDVV